MPIIILIVAFFVIRALYRAGARRISDDGLCEADRDKLEHDANQRYVKRRDHRATLQESDAVIQRLNRMRQRRK